MSFVTLFSRLSSAGTRVDGQPPSVALASLGTSHTRRQHSRLEAEIQVLKQKLLAHETNSSLCWTLLQNCNRGNQDEQACVCAYSRGSCFLKTSTAHTGQSLLRTDPAKTDIISNIVKRKQKQTTNSSNNLLAMPTAPSTGFRVNTEPPIFRSSRKPVKVKKGSEGMTKNKSLEKSETNSSSVISAHNSSFDYRAHVRKQIDLTEIAEGKKFANEYEIVPFTKFDLNKVYPAVLELGKRVIEKPIAHKRRDLMEVIFHALRDLNSKRSRNQAKFSSGDLVEGIYRNHPPSGTYYELYFRQAGFRNNRTSYVKVALFRPFGPIETLEEKQVDTSQQLINIILPLSGRADTFRKFLLNFEAVCVRQDRRVFLTVVHFGTDGLDAVRAGIASLRNRTNFNNVKLMNINETFNRGRGLQIGARSWSGTNVLLFLCDVDVLFSAEFLERCRNNAAPGRKVYFPIVFSLYNPSIVYPALGRRVPPETEQLIISRDTGYWRDFGFGMTCQYRSDFLNIRGFSQDIVGWGGEDIHLYRKYVHSKLLVVRAPDPGIFHTWHEKTCDSSLSNDQYNMCVQSRALNEASHSQLGVLALQRYAPAQNKLRRHS